MVAARAACSHSAERQSGNRELDGAGVVRDAARLHTLLECRSLAGTAAEQVGGKRMRPGGDEGQGLGQVRHLEDREQGAENLLLHHRRIRCHSGEDCRFEIARRPIMAPTEHHTAVSQETHQPVEMLLGDDPAVVGTDRGILPVEACHRPCQRRLELRRQLRRREEVIGCHAGLPRVHEFAVGDAARRGLEVPAQYDGG